MSHSLQAELNSLNLEPELNQLKRLFRYLVRAQVSLTRVILEVRHAKTAVLC